MDDVHSYPKSLHLNSRPGQEAQKGSSQPSSQKRGAEKQMGDQEGERERMDNEELEMGMVSLIFCCTALMYCQPRLEARKAFCMCLKEASTEILILSG